MIPGGVVPTEDTSHDTGKVIGDYCAKAVGCKDFLEEVKAVIWRIIRHKVVSNANIEEIVESSERRCEMFPGTTFDGVIGR